MPSQVEPSQVVPGQVVTVKPGPGRALEEVLAARLADKGPQPCAVVIATGEASDELRDVPEQALVDLLCGPLGIGAVVPLLYDEHDRVAEAGTFAGPGATVAPFNTGAALSAPEHAFRRDVPGTSSAVVAVSAERAGGPVYRRSKILRRTSRSATCLTTSVPEGSASFTSPRGVSGLRLGSHQGRLRRPAPMGRP